MIHNLSDESLRYLDQASTLKAKNFPALFNYYEALTPTEGSAFMAALKKENPRAVTAYNKSINESREKRIKQSNKQLKQEERQYLALWSDEKILEAVKKINAHFCGVIFNGNYYKLDLPTTIKGIYLPISSVTLSVFFQMLRYKKEEGMSFPLGEKEIIYICPSQKDREETIARHREMLQKNNKNLLERGYSSLW